MLCLRLNDLNCVSELNSQVAFCGDLSPCLKMDLAEDGL
jgi:hypothetical protein